MKPIRPIHRAPFAVWLLIGIVLAVGLVLATPVLIYGASAASGCIDKPSTGCGIMGIVVAMIYLPLVGLIGCVWLTLLTMRRLRSIGLPVWPGLLVTLLLAADWTMLSAIAPPWSYGFSMGVLGLSLPSMTLAALILLLAGIVTPAQRDVGPSGLQIGIAAALAAVLAVLALVALMPAELRMHALSDHAFGRPVLTALNRFATLVPWIALALAGVLLWIGLQPLGGTPRPTNAGRFPPLPWIRMCILALAAACIAVVAVAPSMGAAMVIAGFVPIVLPTAALYLLPIAAYVAMGRRRTVASVLLMLLTLSPFVHWGYSHWQILSAQRMEAEAVAALPRLPMSIVPKALVTEGDVVTDALLKFPGVETVIDRRGERLWQFWGRDFQRSSAERTTPLPDTYLLIRGGDAADLHIERTRYHPDGGPYEIVEVSPAGETLLASYYRTLPPKLGWLPVLTTRGWYTDNVIRSEDAPPGLRALLESVLGPELVIDAGYDPPVAEIRLPKRLGSRTIKDLLDAAAD